MVWDLTASTTTLTQSATKQQQIVVASVISVVRAHRIKTMEACCVSLSGEFCTVDGYEKKPEKSSTCWSN